MSVDTTQINLEMVRTFVNEREQAGKTSKPSFSFECIGLMEGCKLYVSGGKEAIGEVAKRPTLFKTNRVLLYFNKKEYTSLEDAEKAHKTHLGKSAKSATGWKYFRAELSDGKVTARLTLRSLWDLYPDIESALSGALGEANKPKTKPNQSVSKIKESEKDKLIKKLMAENQALQDKAK